MTRIPRSWLFIPADSERKLAKARETGAHAVILDLEDAVSADRKQVGRITAANWLNSDAGQSADQQTWVRINAIDTGLWREDLAAIAPAMPDGVMLPKSAGPEDVALISAELDRLGADQVRILPLVSETPRAAITIPHYLNQPLPRLAGLTWGAEDLGAELGVTRKRMPDGRWTDAFRMVRAQTLLAAHALGVWAIDTLHADFRDEAGLATVATAAAADGFASMLAIHPGQVPIINRAFAPDDAALAEARAIVAAFAANPGVGALQLDGKMLDQPHLRAAKALLGIA